MMIILLHLIVECRDETLSAGTLETVEDLVKNVAPLINIKKNA